MSDKSICHFRGVGSILLILFYFGWKSLLADTVDPDQMPHDVASDLVLQCLPMTLFTGFQVRIGHKAMSSLILKHLTISNNIEYWICIT